MTAHVTITHYGERVVTVCSDCGERIEHGANHEAAARDAARHNAEVHRAA